MGGISDAGRHLLCPVDVAPWRPNINVGFSHVGSQDTIMLIRAFIQICLTVTSLVLAAAPQGGELSDLDDEDISIYDEPAGTTVGSLEGSTDSIGVVASKDSITTTTTSATDKSLPSLPVEKAQGPFPKARGVKRKSPPKDAVESASSFPSSSSFTDQSLSAYPDIDIFFLACKLFGYAV